MINRPLNPPTVFCDSVPTSADTATVDRARRASRAAVLMAALYPQPRVLTRSGEMRGIVPERRFRRDGDQEPRPLAVACRSAASLRLRGACALRSTARW